jgi:Silencing defective 2 N-terminal ubiquitin domain
MASNINVLLDTFPGLSLPPTVCITVPSSSSTKELLSHITSLLPHALPPSTRLLLTTTSNRTVPSSPSTTLADLAAPTPSSCLLPLRLSAPLVGGKGGFGSQLRAAGGRMSSRKKRSATDPNGSSRNLDGRRLRTITEAKNLAAYLATKPQMDRAEKEERQRRWQAVVDLAERREEEMRRGIGADGRRMGLSDEWVESKEEIGEGVRNAVAMAMKAASESEKEEADAVEGGANSASASGGSRNGSPEDSDEDEEDDDGMELDDNDMARLRAEAEAGDSDAIWVLKNRIKIPPPIKKQERTFVGFDEDDEFLSSDDSGLEDVKGKGKAVAVI